MKPLKVFIFFIFVLACCPKNAIADTIDNFQIYVKQVLRMNDGGFGSGAKDRNLLMLTKSDTNDTLSISFNHCVAGARQRRIKLIAGSHKLIFDWVFPDKDIERLMQIPIRQLMDYLQLKPETTLALYYFDDDLPDGKLLTYIQSSNE